MIATNELNKFVYDQQRQNPAGIKVSKENQIVDELEYFANKVKEDNANFNHQNAVDSLYKREVGMIDKNLKDMFEFLKPQAKAIYYNRKVEYINLVNEKKKADLAKQTHILTTVKEREDNFQSDYQKQKNELINLMNRYDIPHPLRGPAYDHIKPGKLAFRDKIIGIVSTQNSFLGYKRDLRKTLETSKLLSDEVKKEIEDKQNKIRTIMKYRLYGKDGINKHEFRKLIEWDIIKKNESALPQRVKKRRTRVIRGADGKQDTISEEVSGSGSSNYSMKRVNQYEENDINGNPYTTNEGFQLQPLPKEIYGRMKSIKSELKHKLIKEMSESPDKTFFNSKSSRLNLPDLNKTKRNRFMDRNNSVQVTQPTPLAQNTINVASGSDLDYIQQKLTNTTLDLSFLPQSSRPKMVAKNLPQIKQPILKPFHAKNPNMITAANSTMKGFQTLQIDQDSEHDFLNETIQNLDLQNTIHGDQSPESIVVGNERIKFKTNFGALIKNQSGLSSIQQDSPKHHFLVQNSTKGSLSMRNRRNNSMVEQLSKISSLVKRDNRCNPGSPFRFNANHVFKSNLERKAIGNGRLNRHIKGATSTLKDPDIRQLLSQYPVDGRHDTEQDQEKSKEDNPADDDLVSNLTHLKNPQINLLHNDPTIKALKNKDRRNANKMYRRAFENMIKNIDHIDRQKNDIVEEIITKMVQQNIRDEELQKLVNYMKENDYAEPSKIIPLYDIKIADDIEAVKIAQEVSKEYREGKLDPHNTNMKLKKKHK